jgi:hypothetical protein
MNVEAVKDSLSFAKQRLDELKKLNDGDLAGAKHENRQPLIQEFFFHLVGAVDILAQVINKKRSLSLCPAQVSVREVLKKLGNSDPIKPLLSQLYPTTRSKEHKWRPLPQDPYSDEGMNFRIVVLRHWVNHCGENPFFIRRGDETKPHISLFLDPRYPNLGGSKFPAIDELEDFWKLVNDECQQVIRNF